MQPAMHLHRLNTAIAEQDFAAAANTVEQWVSQYGLNDTTRWAIQMVSKLIEDKLAYDWDFWDFDPLDHMSELPPSLQPRTAEDAATFDAFLSDLDSILDSGPVIYPIAAPPYLMVAAEKMRLLQDASRRTTKKQNWSQKPQSINLEDKQQVEVQYQHGTQHAHLEEHAFGAQQDIVAWQGPEYGRASSQDSAPYQAPAPETSTVHGKRKCDEPHTPVQAKKRQTNDHHLETGLRAGLTQSPEPFGSTTSKGQTSGFTYHSSPLPRSHSNCPSLSYTISPGSTLSAGSKEEITTGQHSEEDAHDVRVFKPNTNGEMAATPKSNRSTPGKGDKVTIPREMRGRTSQELQKLAARLRRQINEWKDERDEVGATMEDKKRGGQSRCAEERVLRRQLQDKCKGYEKKFAKVQAELEKRGQAVTGDSDTPLY